MEGRTTVDGRQLQPSFLARRLAGLPSEITCMIFELVFVEHMQPTKMERIAVDGDSVVSSTAVLSVAHQLGCAAFVRRFTFCFADPEVLTHWLYICPAGARRLVRSVMLDIRQFRFVATAKTWGLDAVRALWLRMPDIKELFIRDQGQIVEGSPIGEYLLQFRNTELHLWRTLPNRQVRSKTDDRWRELVCEAAGSPGGVIKRRKRVVAVATPMTQARDRWLLNKHSIGLELWDRQRRLQSLRGPRRLGIDTRGYPYYSNARRHVRFGRPEPFSASHEAQRSGNVGVTLEWGTE